MAPNVSTHMPSHIPSMITRVSTLSEASPVAESSVWTDEMGAASDQLFFVTSYSDFEKLGKI
eukprot:scaffold40115_cov58-Attheya_sp.AAC.10